MLKWYHLSHRVDAKPSGEIGFNIAFVIAVGDKDTELSFQGGVVIARMVEDSDGAKRMVRYLRLCTSEQLNR
jgi:hypothetical protein